MAGVSIDHVDGLEQDCSISIADALEILQSSNMSSMYTLVLWAVMMSWTPGPVSISQITYHNKIQ